MALEGKNIYVPSAFAQGIKPKAQMFIGFFSRSGPKSKIPIPAKCAEIIELSSKYWPLGIPNQIHQIHRVQSKCIQPCRTDPGVPTPGARMAVVYTNSLKLYD
jgi:hypothetical protein